jgi:hypothetical protein
VAKGLSFAPKLKCTALLTGIELHVEHARSGIERRAVVLTIALALHSHLESSWLLFMQLYFLCGLNFASV